MATSVLKTKRLNERLRKLTKDLRGLKGRPLRRKFHCPILLTEEVAELCKGHVLPRSMGGKEWVLQRKDVDNFFGTFAEADFSHGVRLRKLDSSSDPTKALEHVQRHRLSEKVGLGVEVRNGVFAPAVAYRGRGREVELRVMSRLLEDDRTEGRLIFNLNMMFATTISCIHSMHLGSFKQCGYAYIADKSGQFIASMLGALFRAYGGDDNKAARKGLATNPGDFPDQWQLFRNLVRRLMDGGKSLDPRLLESPFEWFHVAWDGDAFFATVHYLKVENECFAVMGYTTFDERSAAHACSAQPLSFAVSLGHFARDAIEVGTRKTNVVWPCGDTPEPPVPLSRAAAIMRGRMMAEPAKT